MASVSKLKVDQLLYRTFKGKMGNTTISTTKLYTYKVIDIDLVNKTAKLYSIQTQRIKVYKESELKLFRVNKPVLKESFTGSKSIVSHHKKK